MTTRITTKNGAPQFVCYEPLPDWKLLPEFEQAVRAALHDARGFMRRDGVSLSALWRELATRAGLSAADCKLSRGRSERLEIALERLADVGQARRLANGQWVAP